MSEPVYILGGAQSDFARNFSREGLDISTMMRDVIFSGLSAAKLDPSDIEVVHVGNFVAELFCHQGMLGGIVAGLGPEFAGLPTGRHEAACASGSLAVLGAMRDIEAGQYDLACVLGVEYMRNVDGATGAKYLGAAAMAGEEWTDARFLWPRAFSDLTEEYTRRYGEVSYDHIGAIAKKNYDNARRNPNAQTRNWSFSNASFEKDDIANPVIEGHVRKADCGQITDGGAVVFLASEKRARQYAAQRGTTVETLPRIKGWGHKTGPMRFRDKLAQSKDAPLVFPHVAQTIQNAFGRAGINHVTDLNGLETHDCFAMTEYMAIDHFGITAPGESWKAVEEGMTEMNGTIPINASGGLIGLGHPVGATGVRMVLDCFKQTSGQAGDYQIEGAQNMATLNIGGSLTTAVSFVIGRD